MGDINAATFEVVLQFMYTDALTDLPREFMEARAAEELFDAADRLLLFAMKVGIHLGGSTCRCPRTPMMQELQRANLACNMDCML